MDTFFTRKFHSFCGDLDFPALVLSVIAAACAALLVTASPMIGMGAVAGLMVFAVVAKRAEIPFSLLFLSFAIPIQKSIGGIPLNMSDGVIVLWGMAWPFLMMRREGKPFEIPFIVWAALPLIISASLSLLFAVNPASSTKQLLRLIEWFMVLPILMTSFNVTQNFWRWIALLFLCIPCLFAIDGIVEALRHGNSISRMLHIPVPIPSIEHSFIRHTYDISGRAGSTFGGAQGLAMYLAMMMSVIVAIILTPPARLTRKLAMVALVICLAGLFVAKSRGGYLGTGVMFFTIILAAKPRTGFTMMLFGGLAYCGC